MNQLHFCNESLSWLWLFAVAQHSIFISSWCYFHNFVMDCDENQVLNSGVTPLITTLVLNM